MPENGVYLFFQRGEATQWQNGIIDRVVRVDTQREDGRLGDRISSNMVMSAHSEATEAEAYFVELLSASSAVS